MLGLCVYLLLIRRKAKKNAEAAAGKKLPREPIAPDYVKGLDMALFGPLAYGLEEYAVVGEKKSAAFDIELLRTVPFN